MESKFFTFIKPFLNYVDSGNFFRKPISWLYALIAGLNLLLPIFILYQAIDSGVLNSQNYAYIREIEPGIYIKTIIVFIFSFLIISVVSWLGFQLWWDRRSKVNQTSDEGAEFVATPVISHIVQTFGEWLGMWVAIVGFSTSLLTALLMGNYGSGFASSLGIGMFDSGIYGIFLMPVIGFLIIVIFRFFAEFFKALTSIANNTRKQLKFFNPEAHE
ncbi:MAG: hypothetical protein KGZ97_05880 [Bacteroidetes bacterium]|nr:hypothetical protein [Bacteroidota bacterium]